MLPGANVVPEAVLVAVRAAGEGGTAATVVVTVALSSAGSGSSFNGASATVLERTVPAATDEATFATRVNAALPGARAVAKQETIPPAPTAGWSCTTPAA